MLLGLSLAGCDRGGGAAAAMPRDRFVKVNVAMRAIPDSAADAQRKRAELLKGEKLTRKHLDGFVAAHARDPEYLAAVWREIADSVEARNSRKRPPPPDGDAGKAPPSAGAVVDGPGPPGSVAEPPDAATIPAKARIVVEPARTQTRDTPRSAAGARPDGTTLRPGWRPQVPPAGGKAPPPPPPPPRP